MPVCPKCGTASQMHSRFCDQCGGSLDGAPSAGSRPRMIRIGREADNDIVIPSHQMQVGRYHAEVRVDGSGNLAIQDMGTTNGTYVNGNRTQGGVSFSLNDEINFGSYVFNTALLQPHLASKPAVRRGELRPPPMGRVAGQPRVYARGTFLDRAFSEEGSWMPAFLLTYGIIMIVLFFFPMFITEDAVVTAITMLGEQDVSGFLKLTLALLPVIGVCLLVLRSAKAGKTVVGAILLGATIPAFGIITISSPLLEELPAGMTWHFVFEWLFICGTACALVYLSHRPRDGMGRTLLSVFAGMLALSYFLPMQWGGESSFKLAVAIKSLENASAPVVLGVVLGLLPFILGLASLSFLSQTLARERRDVAQYLAVALALLPAFSWLVVSMLAAIDYEAAGLIATGLWLSLFQGYLYLFPVFGGSLLLLGVRRAQ